MFLYYTSTVLLSPMGYAPNVQIEEFRSKTFAMMLKLLFIFGIPAVAGFFLGRYVDARFDMRPTGTLIVLMITFVFSWAIVIRMFITLERERRELEKKNQEEKKSEQN